ncbi:MAG: OmpH family outer membrane protein [Alistipes sp.]|jgi:outer membrane protein|nr:OmpH family outer membrane protein [Alistipes sp.]MBQ5861644.1 OmpH family outer membrane protein [Alistipes sp.]
MKKIFLSLMVAAMAFTACEQKAATEPATEGDAAATEAVVEGDLAYVRVEYVLAESEIFKTEGVALQEKSEKAQKSWAQKEKNLQYEATQLQEKYQKGLMTTADFQQKGQALEKRAANFQTNAQKEMQSLEEENFVFTNRSQDLLMRAIKEINAEGKYKMVVNATALLDAAAALDISDAVLAKVNELYAKEKNAPATEEPATK